MPRTALRATPPAQAETTAPRDLLTALSHYGYGNWYWGWLGSCAGLHAAVPTVKRGGDILVIVGRRSANAGWAISDYDRPAYQDVLRVYGGALTHDQPTTRVHEVHRWPDLLAAVIQLHGEIVDRGGALSPNAPTCATAGRVAYHWVQESRDDPHRRVPDWERRLVRWP